MAMQNRRAHRRPWHVIALVTLPLALGGCLAREPEFLASETNAVATVPTRFFTATVAALPPSAPPQGRYTLGALTGLDTADPANTYATALLQPETRGLRLTLRVDGLSTPTPPPVNYRIGDRQRRLSPARRW